MTHFKLKDLNPLVFIVILLLVSVLISLDKMPFLSRTLVICVLVIQLMWSNNGKLVVLKQTAYPFALGSVYVFFIWLTRKLGGMPIDYLYLLTLIGRFMVFASYTFLLINNVTTKRLTIALIKYLKMPNKIGYAFMAVYNFVPLFRKELTQIQYTYAIRGLNKKGLFGKVQNMFQYAIPLLVTSIRKGMRLSVSMENRGLGKYPTRTYYQDLTFSRRDSLFLSLFLIVLCGLVIIYGYYGLINL